MFTSASCLTNLMYIMGSYKESKQSIIAHVQAILTYTELVNPDYAIFKRAIMSGFPGLEDAVQYFTALSVSGMDYFITSNTKDFRKATVQLPVLSPKQFMNLYEKRHRH